MHLVLLYKSGAHNRNRTDDLFLTKEVLCRLSYMGNKFRHLYLLLNHRQFWSGWRESNPHYQLGRLKFYH